MTEQDEHLERVSSRIALAILEFCDSATLFRADELRRCVGDRCRNSAPASADRVLRDLRRKKRLDYEVVDRRASLYRVVREVKQDEFEW